MAKHRAKRKNRPCRSNYTPARRLMNKVRRIQRHVKRYPGDEQSLIALGKAQKRV